MAFYYKFPLIVALAGFYKIRPVSIQNQHQKQIKENRKPTKGQTKLNILLDYMRSVYYWPQIICALCTVRQSDNQSVNMNMLVKLRKKGERRKKNINNNL